jgi:hypothetical protein
MMACWLTLAIWVADPTAAPTLPSVNPLALESSAWEGSGGSLRLQAIQVPEENLVEQIRRFLPDPAQSMSPAALAELIENHRVRQRWGQEQRPVEGRLQATIDPIAGRLSGKSSWTWAGPPSGRAALQPWNLLVRNVRLSPATSESPLWGATDQAALLVLFPDATSRTLEIDWELQGLERAGGIDFRLRLPAGSVNSLELTTPSQWRVRSTGPTLSQGDSPILQLLPDMTGTISFWIAPWTGQQRSLLAASATSRVEALVEPGGTRIKAAIDVTRIGPADQAVRFVLRESSGGLQPRADQPGDWTLESSRDGESVWLFEPTGPTRERLVVDFEGATPSPPVEVAEEAAWELPSVRLADGNMLWEEVVLSISQDLQLATLSPGSYRLESSRAEDSGLLRLMFRGAEGSVRPSFAVRPRPPILMVRGKTSLDLSVEPVRVTGRWQISAESGTVSLLEAILPQGWNLASARMEDANPSPIRSQEREDGSSSVSIPLSEPLRAGRSASLEIVAELDETVLQPAGLTRLALPEIRIEGSRANEPLLYSIQTNPETPCNLEELPPPRSNSGETEPGDAYVFEYLLPLPSTSITLQPALPRFRGRLDHQIRRRPSDWRQEWTLDLEVLQGSLETLHIVSNRPLPGGITWSINDAENGVTEFTRFPDSISSPAVGVLQPRREQAPDEVDEPAAPASDSSQEYHYQLRTALPVRKSARLLAVWDQKGERVEPPLLQLPDAQEFVAQVSVESRTGRVIEVQTRGLVPVRPEGTAPKVDRSIVWSGQYDPLEKHVSLELTASVDEPIKPASMGRAVIRCVSRSETDAAGQSIEMVLENEHPGPLLVRLPEQSYILQVILDGVARSPGLRDGSLEITPMLEPGIHACRLVFTCPTRSWFGLDHLALPTPIHGWDIVATTWTIERNTGAYVYADPSLDLVSHLQTIEGGLRAPFVVLTDDERSRETVARLRRAFSGLSEQGRESTSETLVTLANALLPGGVAAFGRRALAATEVHSPHPARSADTADLADWLDARDIWILVVDSSVMFTKRGPAIMGGQVRSNWNWERWTRQTVDEVRANGISRDGQFVGTVEDDTFRKPLPPSDLEKGSARRISWTYVVTGPSDGFAYDVLMVSQELLTRLSRLGIVVSIVSILAFCRDWSIASHRRLLAGLLLGSMLTASYGGWAHHLLSVPLWAGIATSVGLLLRRISRTKAGPSESVPAVGISGDSATVVASLGVILGLVAVGEPLWGEETRPERILLPVSPTGEVKRVIVPESLIRELQNQAPIRDRVLLTRSEYRGEPAAEGRYLWHGVLVGSVERFGSDRRIILPLGGIEPRRLVVNGTPVVDDRPAGVQGAVEFILPTDQDRAIESFRVEIDFETPALGVGDERSISFRIPPASVTDIRLAVDRDAVIDPASRSSGWQSTTIDGNHYLSRESGPMDGVLVRWRRPGSPLAPAAPVEIETIRLIEIGGPVAELAVTFRATLPTSVQGLVFPMSKKFILREIEGEGIRDWRVEPFGEDRRALLVDVEPSPKPRQWTIRGEASIDPGGPFVVPEISLEGSGAERGVVGVTTAAGWQSSLVQARSAKVTSEADFLAFWSRLEREPAPTKLHATLRVEREGSSEPASITFEVLRDPQRWSVEQDLSIQLDPIWKTTLVEATIRAKTNAPDQGPLVMEIPVGAKVIRASGKHLREWIEQGDELSLFLADPGSESASVSLSLQIPWELSSRRVTGRATRSLVPLRWLSADATQTRWQIRTSPGWTIAAAPAPGSKERATPSQTLARQTTGQDPLLVQLAPEAQELSAETLTRVTIRDGQTEVEGIIQLHVDRGTVGRVDFRTRGGLRNIQWEVDKMSPPTSEERGGERIWVYRAGRSVQGDLTLRWRTSKLFDTDESSIPRVIVDAPAKTRDWVSVVNLSGRSIELRSPGLVATPLPPALQSLGGALAAETTVGTQTFLAESSDWQMSFVLEKKETSPPAFDVLWVDHDLLVGELGRIRGRSVWLWVDQGEGTMEFRKEPGVECDMLIVDEQPLTAFRSMPTRLQVPIFRKGRAQRTVIEWSMPAPVSAQEIPLPTIVGANPHPLLVRARHARQSGAVLRGDSPISRATWLAERLRRWVDQLSSRMRPDLTDLEQVELKQDLALTRAWENELLSAIRVEEPPTGIKEDRSASTEKQTDAMGAIEELVEKRRLLEGQILERFAGPTERTTLAESLWLWEATENLAIEDALYLRADSPTLSLQADTRVSFEWRYFTTNELVRIGVSALSLILVLVDRLWFSMRLYWPAPMLTAGVAWILFADSPLFGWGLILIALVGGFRSIRRWLDEPVRDFVSTVLVLPTRFTSSSSRSARTDSLEQ